MASINDFLKYLIKWDEFDNYIICDVCQKSYDRVIEYAVQNIFYKNFVYQKLGIPKEEKGEENFRKIVKKILASESCIMIISRDEREIFGLALLSIMTKEWRSWVSLQQTVSRNSLFYDIVNLQIGRIETQAQKQPDGVYDCMFINNYTAADHLLNNKDFVKVLFGAFVNVTRHMKQARVVTVAMTIREQMFAQENGFTELEQTIYSIYKVSGDRRPFDILRTYDEMCSYLYEMEVSPLTPYLELPGFEVYHEQFAKRQLE